jgi:hypothetical protein
MSTMGQVIGTPGVVVDWFRAYGHPNISARHRSTMEFTKEAGVTERGDCIIGVRSTKSPLELREDLKAMLRSRSLIVVIMRVQDYVDWVVGFGDPRLTLSDEYRLIIRRSDYVDGATLMVRANKAAADLGRGFVDSLKRGEAIDVYIVGVSLG